MCQLCKILEAAGLKPQEHGPQPAVKPELVELIKRFMLALKAHGELDAKFGHAQGLYGQNIERMPPELVDEFEASCLEAASHFNAVARILRERKNPTCATDIKP